MNRFILVTGLGGLLSTSACSSNRVVKTTCKAGISDGDACSTNGSICIPAEDLPEPCPPDEYICTDNKWDSSYTMPCNPPATPLPEETKQIETSKEDVEKSKETPKKNTTQPSNAKKEK